MTSIAADPTPATSRLNARLLRVVLWGALAAVVLVLCLTTERFLSVENLRAILIASATVGITALGATFITLVGSIGSLATTQQVGVLAMVFLATQSWGLVPALLVTVAAGIVLGAAQGYAVGAWSANAIVLTIALGFGLGGLATWLTDGKIVAPTGTEYTILNATPLGVPVSVYVMCAIALLAQAVLHWTVPGRQVLYVGENSRAARAAGISIGWITVFAWTMFGITSATGAAFFASFNHQANVMLAGNLTFDVIAAILVGGALISGGKGSPLGTLGGAIAIAAITNLLLLRGFSSGAQLLLKGVLVVLIVVIVHLRNRGGSR
jgi:ribose/xylose/arabinose/galactoside ABC-type transport system permease subunit